jgi:hypothetical protein
VSRSLAARLSANSGVEKYLKRLVGLRKTEIQDALQRLDMLTAEEARETGARTLAVTHGVDGNVKKIKEVTQDIDNTVTATQDLTQNVDCNVKVVGGDVKAARELIQDVDGNVKVVEQVTRSIDDNVKILIKGAQTFLSSCTCQPTFPLCQNSNDG